MHLEIYKKNGKGWDDMGLISFLKALFQPIDNRTSLETSSKETSMPGPEINDVGTTSEFDNSSYPSKQGLYPHEILALDYASSFLTEQSEFQGFWYYQYGIKDMKALLRSLYRRGFLEIGGIEQTLDMMKVIELKKELKTRGLKVSGNKKQLIERMLAEIPAQQLERNFPLRFFKLSEKGHEELKAEEYIPYIHNHQELGISIWEMNRMMHDRPAQGYGFRDEIWRYLNRTSTKYMSKGQYGLYRCTRLNMYYQLAEINKWTNALRMLAEVIAYDLSGLDNYLFSKYISSRDIQGYFVYEQSSIRIAPAIYEYLNECRVHLELTSEQLMTKLGEYLELIKLPYRIFGTDECLQIVKAEMDYDMQTLKRLYALAGTRYHDWLKQHR